VAAVKDPIRELLILEFLDFTSLDQENAEKTGFGIGT
jgi:hypothetical protein